MYTPQVARTDEVDAQAATGLGKVAFAEVFKKQCLEKPSL